MLGLKIQTGQKPVIELFLKKFLLISFWKLSKKGRGGALKLLFFFYLGCFGFRLWLRLLLGLKIQTGQKKLFLFYFILLFSAIIIPTRPGFGFGFSQALGLAIYYWTKVTLQNKPK